MKLRRPRVIRKPKPFVKDFVDNVSMDDFELEYQKFIADLKTKKEENETITQEEDTTNLQSDEHEGC